MWNDAKADKAVKLITGSKKVGLGVAYGVVLYKIGKAVIFWGVTKAAPLIALVTSL